MAKNNQNNKQPKEKLDKRTFYTRILCLVLAGLMVASGAFVILEALL